MQDYTIDTSSGASALYISVNSMDSTSAVPSKAHRREGPPKPKRNVHVSVLCPVYNAEKYLPECIESVLSQTYGDIEFVLYNDGSTDGSVDVIQYYARQDRRIRLIDNSMNLHRLHARNELIRACRTEFATWIDNDDVYERDFVELAVGVQQVEDYDIVQLWTSCMVKEDDVFVKTPEQFVKNSPMGVFRGETILPTILEKFVSTRFLLWTKLFRTSLLKKCLLPFEGRFFSDDYFYAVPLLYNAHSYISYETGKYIHRYRTGGNLAKLDRMDAVQYKELCRFIHAVLKWWLDYLRGQNPNISLEILRICARSADIQLCAQKAVDIWRRDGENVIPTFCQHFCKGTQPLVDDSLEYPEFTELLRNRLRRNLPFDDQTQGNFS